MICGAIHYAECGILRRHLDWMARKGRRPNTTGARRRHILRLGEFLRPVPVTDASTPDLNAWRDSIAGLASQSILTYASGIREFYGWLFAEQIRPDNPAAGMPLPRKTQYAARPISEENLMRALDHAPPRVRPWLVLAGWAGLRCCEIAGLRRLNVFDRAVPPYLIVDAASVKGGRGERVIPLSAFVVAELRAHGLPAAPGAYVFPRMDGRPGPNEAWLVSGLGNEVLHRAGIPDTMHALRHRFGTSCWRASKDLLAVQALMGHADPKTTLVYVAADNQAAVDAVNALPVPPRLRVVRERGGSA